MEVIEPLMNHREEECVDAKQKDKEKTCISRYAGGKNNKASAIRTLPHKAWKMKTTKMEMVEQTAAGCCKLDYYYRLRYYYLCYCHSFYYKIETMMEGTSFDREHTLVMGNDDDSDPSVALFELQKEVGK